MEEKKSYFSLTKLEKKELKDEFKRINPRFNFFPIGLGLLLVDLVPFIILLSIKKINEIDFTKLSLFGYATLFVLPIGVLIMIFSIVKNGIYNKQFNNWLTTKGIIK